MPTGGAVMIKNTNYLCNQCLSQLQFWVRTPFMAMCIQCNIMW